jgi:hypothetical protein
LIIENPNVDEIDADIKTVKWVNLKCNIQTNDVPDGYKIDIRTKYNDASTSVIDRSNRDFTDVHNTVEEPQPAKTLRFIEDYTLAILSISYFFMIIAIIYIYTSTSEFKLIAFGKSFVGSIFLTMFLFIFLFYIT